MKEKRLNVSTALCRVPILCFAMASVAVNGQQIEQTVTLSNGWNAVYVSVSPSAPADEVFAGWPVWSVSAYNAQSFLSIGSTAGGKTGESVVNAPYWIWSREAPQASSLKALTADTVIWCYATNSTPFTVTLRGKPAAPRIATCRNADGPAAYPKAVDERIETPIGPIPPLTLRG